MDSVGEEPGGKITKRDEQQNNGNLPRYKYLDPWFTPRSSQDAIKGNLAQFQKVCRVNSMAGMKAGHYWSKYGSVSVTAGRWWATFGKGAWLAHLRLFFNAMTRPVRGILHWHCEHSQVFSDTSSPIPRLAACHVPRIKQGTAGSLHRDEDSLRDKTSGMVSSWWVCARLFWLRVRVGGWVRGTFCHPSWRGTRAEATAVTIRAGSAIVSTYPPPHP